MEEDNNVFDAADSSSLCLVDEFASNGSKDFVVYAERTQKSLEFNVTRAWCGNRLE